MSYLFFFIDWLAIGYLGIKYLLLLFLFGLPDEKDFTKFFFS